MKNLLLSLLFIGSSFFSQAQISASISGSMGTNTFVGNLAGQYDFTLLSSEKLHIKPGIRVGLFSASNLDFLTAPADLTIDEANMDTVSFASAAIISTNIFLDIEYDITQRLNIGFDIDLAGMSFGGDQNTGNIRGGANSIANPKTDVSSNASPTSTNLLLVGDNDLGTLSSNFYLGFDFLENLNVSAGLNFIFTEYTSDLAIGFSDNDRWRNKSALGFVSVEYAF